ncbi:hypothetical protein BgiMline_024456, partial [Biomphalaria glabrata]
DGTRGRGEARIVSVKATQLLPRFDVLLRFYPDPTQLIPRFYPACSQVLPSLYPGSTQLVANLYTVDDSASISKS